MRGVNELPLYTPPKVQPAANPLMQKLMNQFREKHSAANGSSGSNNTGRHARDGFEDSNHGEKERRDHMVALLNVRCWRDTLT